MIGYLNGVLANIENNGCILDVQGVGYFVYCSNKTIAKLKKLNLEDPPVVKLFTRLIHREDTLDLYGFLTKKDVGFFNMLLTVSGIGPKQALKIMGGCSIEDIIKAIVSENSSFLMGLSGIGKKKSQQIILELKEKLEGTFDISKAVTSHHYYDAITALEALGFNKSESREAVDRALRDTKNKNDVSRIIEDALRILSSNTLQ